MKTILIRTLTSKRLWVVAGICIAVGLTLLVLSRRSTSRFEISYAHYVPLAQAQQEAAYTPSAPNNPVRQRLGSDLALVLAPQTAQAVRLQSARDGLAQLQVLGRQIDEMGQANEQAQAVVARMQVDAASDFSTSGTTLEIIRLAKERTRIVEDIRGLSYRANFETGKIFDRIIADKGQLSAAYVSELNNALPNLESDYDRRTNLYNDLTKVGTQIDDAAKGLSAPLLKGSLSNR